MSAALPPLPACSPMFRLLALVWRAREPLSPADELPLGILRTVRTIGLDFELEDLVWRALREAEKAALKKAAEEAHRRGTSATRWMREALS